MRTTAILILSLIILTAMISPIQSVPTPDKTTITVDMTSDGDYTSIKAAIENATASNIIRIKSGVYEENNIVINKKIELIGGSPTNTIIDCNGKKGFILENSYIELRNIKIVNCDEQNIHVKMGSNSCIISNCTLMTSVNSIGVLVEASDVTITDCEIKGKESTGIGVKIQESNNVVSGCNIHGFNVGVLALINADNNMILNSNLFDNNIAVDIRIRSNNNQLSECNIYSNQQGLKIWQNSGNNLIYLNNFWKNDNDAIAENNNTWDNGNKGNYWDDYKGSDANNDDIGDTPYIISNENTDRYPLMARILPEIILPPTNIQWISSMSDATPTFTWNPPLSQQTLQGYYVKIDSQDEIFIGNTTQWTAASNLSNGVHTFYVKAIGTNNQTSSYASISFSIDTTTLDSDGDGWTDKEEERYGTDPTDPHNYPLDTDGDHIPDSEDNDDDNDGYPDELERSYLTDPKNQYDYPLDTDHDGTPDDDSPDGKYSGDIDDDNDGIPDKTEKQLGSQPKNASDTLKIFLLGKTHYLIDTTNNSIHNILYNPITNATTMIQKHNEKYLLDENGDGTWDYQYSIADGTISKYEEKTILTFPFLVLLNIVILSTAIILIFFYMRKKTLIKKTTERPIQEEKSQKEDLTPKTSEIREEHEKPTPVESRIQTIPEKEIETFLEIPTPEEIKPIEITPDDLIDIKQHIQQTEETSNNKIENQIDKISSKKHNQNHHNHSYE